MSFYCKYCGRQSMNEPFGFETCDDCWDKKEKEDTGCLHNFQDGVCKTCGDVEKGGKEK